ncbi:hypothetical protein CGCVW01_v010282 [Colletotrichum viniferum]|nr:hypothetical protein CGCVW01_v010282 [Colletotrichum viniferum]
MAAAVQSMATAAIQRRTAVQAASRHLVHVLSQGRWCRRMAHVVRPVIPKARPVLGLRSAIVAQSGVTVEARMLTAERDVSWHLVLVRNNSLKRTWIVDVG